MGRKLDFSSLNSALNKCRKVSEEEAMVRKLINLTSKSFLEKKDIDFICNINSSIFLGAYKELSKSLADMKVVKDQVIGEYVKGNLESADIYTSEEEEIY